MTDPLGHVTTYDYSNLELNAVTQGAGTSQAATTSYTYDPATLGVTSVTDPNGNVTTNTYDGNGNLLTSTDPMSNTTSYSYNSFNEVTSKTTPLGVDNQLLLRWKRQTRSKFPIRLETRRPIHTAIVRSQGM